MCQKDGYVRSWSGGFSRTVHVIWHACLDQNVLQVLVWDDVTNPQDHVPDLFWFGMGAWVVDRGFDPLKEKKQTRSGACRSSRDHSHERQAGVTSGSLWGWYAPVGHWDDGWRTFVRRRGRGPSVRLSLRVWIGNWFLTKFSRHMTKGIRFF